MGKPLDFTTAKESFLKELTRRDYAVKTCETYRDNLQHFYDFCIRSGKTDLRCLTQEDILQYQTSVLAKPWAQSTKDKVFIQLKIFFRTLTKEQLILSDPAENLRVKTSRHKNLSPVLSRQEMTKLIDAAKREQQPGEYRGLGLRHGAILELFYSSGLRRRELLRLKQDDIDFNNRVLFISQGKGRKDRVIPLGKKAVQAIAVYLKELRPQLEKPELSQPTLFLSCRGNPLAANTLGQRIRENARRAGITRKVYPHLLRHTMATHLLQNGAPIQIVSSMLGHSRWETSQIYTRVVLNDLKKVWQKYHPRGRFLWTFNREPCPSS